MFNKEKVTPIQPQQNQEAEQALLGLALRDPALLEDGIKDEDFFMADHGMIAQAIRELHEQGLACDPVTVSNLVMTSHGKDLFDYLSDLYALTPPPEHADSYIKVIVDHAYSRRVTQLSTRIKNLGGENLDPSDKRKMIDSLLDELDDSMPQVPVMHTLASGARSMAELVERLADDDTPAIMTGFEAVDDIVNGILPGDLIIVAGRPAMGKTAFALNIAENVATQYRKPVSVFSMEMTVEQLSGRMACSIANIDASKLRRGDLTSNDWVLYAEAVAKMEKMPIHIDDRSGLTVGEIKASIRRMRRAGHNIELVVVDYIQLMEGDGDKRHEQISSISRNLKELAKEMRVGVIALSQLNRDVEKRADKRPMMSDLRDSGAIEQDADAIIFLYRDEVYHQDSPHKGLAEALVAKNRAGSPGVAILGFEGKVTRFRNNSNIYGDPQYVELI